MPRRKKVERQNFLTLNGASYSFKMSKNHLNEQLNEDEILTKICETISQGYETEFPVWTRLPMEGCRVLLITQADNLCECFDGEARMNDYNFLIFERTCDDSIVVTYFGPIGKKQPGTFTEQLNQSDEELKILQDILEKLRSFQNTKSGENKEDDDVGAKVKAEYLTPLRSIEEDTGVKKDELLRLTDNVCVDAKAKEHAHKLIGKINISASTGKIVLRSITAILFAELAEEIAKKFGIKTATKTASKFGMMGSGKLAAKAMPFTGLAVGTAFGIWRVLQGDYSGGGMEFVSGAAACMPGSGTAASLAIDALLMAKDISQASDGSNMELLNSQVKQIESDLNNLSDRYESALAVYEFVKEVLDDCGFSIESLECEIETHYKILSAVRQQPLVTVQGLPVTVMGGSFDTEFDTSLNDMSFVIV